MQNYTGADINKVYNANMSALSLATMLGNQSVVAFLVDKKARIANEQSETIAHVCAYRNECDAACLKRLVEYDGGVGFLFTRSQTTGHTPLQLCVERRSHKFMHALIACENITCVDWFERLYSTDGLGISPLAMAISSQNYEFIQELIDMWYAKFDTTHHSFDGNPANSHFNKRPNKAFAVSERSPFQQGSFCLV